MSLLDIPHLTLPQGGVARTHVCQDDLPERSDVARANAVKARRQMRANFHRRTREHHATILAMLATGVQSSEALMEATGLRPTAFYRCMAQLQREGKVAHGWGLVVIGGEP